MISTQSRHKSTAELDFLFIWNIRAIAFLGKCDAQKPTGGKYADKLMHSYEPILMLVALYQIIAWNDSHWGFRA